MKRLNSREGATHNETMVSQIKLAYEHQHGEVPDFDQEKSYNKYFVRGNCKRVLKRINPVEEYKQVVPPQTRKSIRFVKFEKIG